MKPLSLFLSLILVAVCSGCRQESPSRSQDKEPTYQGKTLSQWLALAKDTTKDESLRASAVKAAVKAIGGWGVRAFRPSQNCSRMGRQILVGRPPGCWG